MKHGNVEYRFIRTYCYIFHNDLPVMSLSTQWLQHRELVWILHRTLLNPADPDQQSKASKSEKQMQTFYNYY